MFMCLGDEWYFGHGIWDILEIAHSSIAINMTFKHIRQVFEAEFMS